MSPTTSCTLWAVPILPAISRWNPMLQSPTHVSVVSVTIESEATLNNRERAKDRERRAVAVNKGEGTPNDAVAAAV